MSLREDSLYQRRTFGIVVFLHTHMENAAVFLARRFLRPVDSPKERLLRSSEKQVGTNRKPVNCGRSSLQFGIQIWRTE